MNKKYSKGAALLGVVCAITLFASYTIAPDQPKGIMIIILRALFFTSILSGILSLFFTSLSFKNKEDGFLKKVAPTILFLVLIILSFSMIGIIISIGDLF
ncbi:hypothetical protein [Metabacillus sp. B2-18]|uniref:hypothetical protein n=1 Tax=Metabacillus sp. B2-18 TaxID=2897333 RepID=UPI001E60E260|nr:hypothetical protein [Metabacillus sp. B2-18]UGB28756.1 hypothetical protein LPC09_13190 [Metabacillus sp. B2-18]